MERLYFTGYKKTEDIYKDIAEAVDTRLDTLNYELDRTLPKETNKKANELENKINCLEKNEIEIDLVQKGS